MKVLSLFDGISCARIALERAGIPVEAYYASEIDKYAIQVSNKNYPDINNVGSVVGLEWNDLSKQFVRNDNGFSSTNLQFDLLIGGSPCQDLSISKSKTRKGLEGNKSSLFYEYLRILKEVKPKYFILENVASMSDESRDIITKELGVMPIELNAQDFSAQSRARYFWTNIPIEYPTKHSEVMLGDILESNVDEKYYYKNVPFEIYQDVTKRVIGIIHVAGHDILKRIYNRLMKSPTVTTCAGGNTQLKVYDNNRIRKLTPREYESLQGLPADYTSGLSNSQRYKCLGNAFNVDVVAYILSFIPNQ